MDIDTSVIDPDQTYHLKLSGQVAAGEIDNPTEHTHRTEMTGAQPATRR